MKRVFLLVGIITLLYSCKKSTKSNDDETWNEIEVVDKLSDNPIFLKMKKNPEIIDEFTEQQNTFLTRSAKGIYVISKDKNFLESTTDTSLTSIAIMPHPDSLILNFGFMNEVVSKGVKIHVRKNLFNVDIFDDVVTCLNIDVIDSETGEKIESKVSTKIYNQKLILNKHAYEIGDSIYGKINFSLMKITDFMERKDTFYYKGAGYFRSNIKKNYH